MKRRTRYLLIIVGFIVFLILAPFIVFYTSGTLFDFGAKEYVATGILSVQTEPADAHIFLDGKEETTTPASIRFLSSKEYTIRVEKDGYFPWSKRLDIKSGKVTWTAEHLPKLQLIKKDQPARTIATDILDAHFSDDKIIALTKNSVNVYDSDSAEVETRIPLPFSVPALETTSQGSLLLGRGPDSLLVINLDDKKVTDLSKELRASTIISFLDTQTILLHDGTGLSTFTIPTKKKTPLLAAVGAATIRESDLYYLRTEGNTNSLVINTLQNGVLSNERILKSGLPVLTGAELLVTTQRELFILSGGTVYRVNDDLEPVASDIVSWEYQNGQSLLLSTPSELIYYDFLTSKPILITRSSGSVTKPVLRQEIGYAFFAQDKNLVALELDTRDHQNRYSLIPVNGITALDANGNAKKLLLLDEGTLKTIVIR